MGIEYNARQAANTGNISFVWTDTKAEERSLEDGSLLFELVLKPKDVRSMMYDVRFGEDLTNNLQLTINNSIADIEAWDKDFNKHNIVLKSKVESQNLKVEEVWSASPNPTSGNVKLGVISTTNKTVVFELTNIYGKTLLQQSFEAVKGNNVYSIDLNKNGKLSTGIYLLKAIGLYGENVKRIIVE